MSALKRLPENVKVVAGGASAAELAELPRVKDAETAMAAVMHMVLKHTADMLRGVLGAVAEHYGLDEEEVVMVAAEHPRVKMLVVEPALQDLGYLVRSAAESAPEFGETPVEPVYREEPAAAAAVVTAQPPQKPKRQWSEAAKAAAAAKRAARKAAAEPPAAEPVAAEPPAAEPVAAGAPTPTAAEPKKRVFKIKPKKVTA
jgi:hypothetical protein